MPAAAVALKKKEEEREEADLGRRMLAGAEGGGGVDQQPDASRRPAALVVRAVDEIAHGRQRREARLVLRKPIARRHALDPERRRRAGALRPGERQRRLDEPRIVFFFKQKTAYEI